MKKCFLLWLGLLFIYDSTVAQVCVAQFSYSVFGYDVILTNESSAEITRPNFIITTDSISIFKDELFDTAAIHYSQPGTYVITLHMYDADSLANCVSIYSDTVTIVEPPICEAKILDKYPTFVNESNGTTPTTTYFWNFGDGATSTLENPAHAFAVAGTYTVYLAIQDTATGCNDTAFLERYFYPTACKGSILYQQDSDIVYFTPRFIPTVFHASSISWDYGDGTQGDQAFHRYDSTGTYLVCCVATDTNLNCTTANICRWVDVICNIGCTPEFSYAENCGIVRFQNGIIYTAPNIQYLWDFGDGTKGEGINVVHDYAIEIGQTKTYNPCLELTDGTTCDNSICHSVTVSCITTGIVIQKTEAEISNLQLFPVPFSDELHLNFTVNQRTPVTIAIYNCLGQKVLDQSLQQQITGEKNLNIACGDLAKGMYILKLTSQNSQITKQLIKQ